MKPPSISFIAAPVCGVVLAVLVHSVRHSSPSADTTTIPVASPSSASSRPGAPSPLSSHQSGHTFAALLRLPPGYPPLSDEDAARLARMTTADLYDLLAQLHAEEFDPATNALKSAMIRAAIAELYHRDSAAAMQWAQTRGDDRGPIVSALITEASLHDPQLAGDWIVQLKNDAGGDVRMASRYAAAIKSNAPLSGAEATLALEQMLADSGLKGYSGSQVPSYAADFDFALYAKNSSSTAAVQDAVLYWTAKDPEAAWTSLRDILPSKPDLFTAMAAGIASLQGEAAAARWATAHLDDLPPDSRTALLRSLATALPLRYSTSEQDSLEHLVSSSTSTTWSYPGGPPPIGDRLTALMSALPGDEDRIALAAGSFSQKTTGQDSLTALQLLPTPELQVRALVASVAGIPAKTTLYARPATWDDYQKAMDRLQLSPEAQATVRAVFPPGK